MYFKVVEEYNRREQEIKHLEKELEEKSNNLSAYRQKITEVCWVGLLSRRELWRILSYHMFHLCVCVSSRLRSVG